MFLPTKSTERELRSIFLKYASEEEDSGEVPNTMTLSALQHMANDYVLPVSSQQIEQFFDINNNEPSNLPPNNSNDAKSDTRKEASGGGNKTAINFIEFAQFVRHQESTVKKLFGKLTYHDKDVITMQVVRNDIEAVASSASHHYFWNFDTQWIESIFERVNARKNRSNKAPIKFSEFRTQALLHSTPALQNFYRMQLEQSKVKKELKHMQRQQRGSNTRRSRDQRIIRIIDEFDSGKENRKSQWSETEATYHTSEREMRNLFDLLSDGKGYISMQTLYSAVKTSKVPVTEHQLMSFFYRCDILEDGKVDFIEFCHFVREEEKAIKRLFDKLDMTHSGKLDPAHIKTALKNHHYKHNSGMVYNEEAVDDWIESIMKSIATSSLENQNTLEITYDDFLRYAILSGSRNLTQISRIFRHSYRFDLIEDIYIPFEEDAEDRIVSQETKNLYKLTSFLSGVQAGIISRTLTAPLDRLKIMMQQYSRGHVRDHASNIMKEGGIRSFWRGNLTNCIKMAPETATKFLMYEHFTKSLENSQYFGKYKGRPFLNFVAGAGAGVVAQSVIYPLEVAKTRLALSKTGQYRNFYDCLRKAYKKEGIGALYQGWQASVGGIVPYAAIEMGVFFTLRNKYKELYGENPGAPTMLAFGATANICGSLVAYPLQLVRTKLQSQGMPGKKKRWDGVLHCLWQTYGKFGIKGLYSGLLPNFAKAIPASSISYTVYLKTNDFLKEKLTE